MTEGSRVAGAADPATLRALAAGRSTTRTLSDDLLTHLPDVGDLPTQRDLVTRAATELDRVGGLLQSWTTTAVESAARVRALEPALTRCDLTIDGRLVVERSGPSRVEPGERRAERDRLQELLNRVTAVRSRELARLRRELEASGTTLAALSDRARSGA